MVVTKPNEKNMNVKVLIPVILVRSEVLLIILNIDFMGLSYI